MSKPEQSDNELIAEFMGWYIEGEPEFKSPYEIWCTPTGARMYPRTDPNGKRYTEKFQYHESWDWLMPVVQKIGDLWSPDFNEMSIQAQHICDLPLNSHIQQVYKEVVDFIKWYNQQNHGTEES